MLTFLPAFIGPLNDCPLLQLSGSSVYIPLTIALRKTYLLGDDVDPRGGAVAEIRALHVPVCIGTQVRGCPCEGEWCNP